MTSHYCNVHIAAECDTDDIHEVKTRAFGFNKAATKICKGTPLNTRPYKRN